ncbi:MAG: lysoplasmalogenase [Bacteroidales bacterium]|nr:lysoplasmalogenase [Bacteroidales bacterium]
MNQRTPIFFFILAVAANLYGCIANEAFRMAAKPALMPLLALSVLVFALNNRVDRRRLGLLVTAQLFGWVGDVLLMWSEFPFFAAGIGAFFIGHFYYLRVFGGLSWRRMSWKTWLPCLLLMGGVVYGLVLLLKIEGTLLIPMAVYGFMLMLLIFSTLCGLFRLKNKGAWFIVLVGTLLFTFSDALIAAGTFGLSHFALHNFTVMATYILAQVLLAVGTLKL